MKLFETGRLSTAYVVHDTTSTFDTTAKGMLCGSTGYSVLVPSQMSEADYKAACDISFVAALAVDTISSTALQF